MNVIHHNAIDLTDQRFGRLVALKPTKERNGNCIVWRCFCDCGNECFVRSNHLRRGRTRSCGCLALDTHTTHGMSYTKIYKVWDAMIQRCENPNNPFYKYYGGRGIKVCERWHKFENFYADVGDPPEGKTLDRWPDNDGDYKLTNFRWATLSQQVNNRRPNSSGRVKQHWFRAWHKDSMAQFISNNQHAFARKWNLRNTHISNCLCDRQNTHKGWTFKRI